MKSQKDITWNLKKVFLKKVNGKGGFVNCHAHFDRAFTINLRKLKLSHKSLKKKWSLVDKIKKKSTQIDFEERIEKAIKLMIKQGVKICASCIDVDSLVGLRAIRAAKKIKEKYKDKITFWLVNQTLKGIFDKKERLWLERSLAYIDIIGGLPSRERPRDEEHLDTLFTYAKQTGKRVHVHIDQENNPHEHDTEMLVRKIIEHNLEGKVTAIHAISLAVQPPKQRKKIYQLMKQAKLSVICCPSAALSMKQLPYKSYLHNSIAPVVELLESGINVALGTDNIADIYQPFNDGDLYTEVKILMEACRFYDLDSLVKLATTDGRKIFKVRS